MSHQNNFDFLGAMRALLGRFPALEDEPQLGVLLQSEVNICTSMFRLMTSTVAYKIFEVVELTLLCSIVINVFLLKDTMLSQACAMWQCQLFAVAIVLW